MTERDQRLMAGLGTYGVLSTRQITELFFQGIRKTTVLRRLRLLEERKLIRRIHGLSDGSLAWCLTALQAEQLGLEFSFGHSNRNTIDHDVCLNDVRISLAKVGLGERWTPEHVLRRQSFRKTSYHANVERVIPDGIVIARKGDDDYTISVELELHAKSRRRYRALFNEYRWSRGISMRWYIVPQRSIGLLVSDEWQKANHGKYSSLMWSLLPEVLNDPWEVHVHQGKATVPLREYIHLTKPPGHQDAQRGAHSQSTTTDPKTDHAVPAAI